MQKCQVMRWNGKINCLMVSQKPKYCKNFERNSHWRKLSMIMVWERYCNASPKPEFFLFSLFIFSFISQLIWVSLGWNFHRWFSIQKQVSWCTIDPFSLKFCTSQHSYPVPLNCVSTGFDAQYEITQYSTMQWIQNIHNVTFGSDIGSIWSFGQLRQSLKLNRNSYQLVRGKALNLGEGDGTPIAKLSQYFSNFW